MVASRPVLVVLFAWLLAATAQAQDLTDRATERCTRAAVRIQVDLPGGSSVGSGSIIDAHGYVLTNLHVVGHVRHESRGGVPGTFYDAEHVQIATVSSARDTATTRYIGRVVRADVRLDLALIRIVSNADGSPIAAGHTFPTVELATTDALQPGAALWAFGFPLGVRTINVTGGHMTGFQMSSSTGSSESALVSWIRTDAEFNPGNSGGMLVDRQGHLVAVPTAVMDSRETLEPIEIARPVERMPSEWRTAMAHHPIDDVVVTGIGELSATGELVDQAVGDSGGLEGAEVLYYRLPADRPGVITVTPAVPLGLVVPSGEIGRDGRGTLRVFAQDPTPLMLAVLVERSEDGTPVDLHLRFEPVAAPPPMPPAYGGYMPTPVPPGYGGYGTVPYGAAPPPYGSAPPPYGSAPPPYGSVPSTPLPPVSVHGRVVDTASGAAIAHAVVMLARPGVDLRTVLALVAQGRMTQAQLEQQLLTRVETAADGSYTLTNVPRGRYMGAAVMAGYPSTLVTLTIGPADPAVVEALPIQMSR